MGITEYLERKKPLIDREMEKAIPRKITEKWLSFALGKPDYMYDSETATRCISEPIWDLLDRGGKRWRPALALLSCEAVGGKEEDALPFTPMVELIHNGTLSQDDVEDDSKMRRGKPCMHLIYGVDIAVNNGSTMYFLPLTLLYRNLHNLPENKIRAIYDIYAEEMLRVSVGQATDIWWHKGGKQNISEGEYLQMVANKTGVLARFAAKLGGIVGGADEKRIHALGKFGEAIGVGFQIQDDILELTEEEFKKGKGSAGGDIHEGKRTLLVIKTLEKAVPADRKRLVEILDSHPTDEETIKEAIGIIEKYGAIQYAQKKSEQIVNNAWKGIDSLLQDSTAKALLHELALFATKRKT
jgi:geranylgeranyl pyrophosphate synthase